MGFQGLRQGISGLKAALRQRTNLYRGHAEAGVLQQHADGAGRDALAQAADHTTRHQHVLHVCWFLRYLLGVRVEMNLFKLLNQAAHTRSGLPPERLLTPVSLLGPD